MASHPLASWYDGQAVFSVLDVSPKTIPATIPAASPKWVQP